MQFSTTVRFAIVSSPDRVATEQFLSAGFQAVAHDDRDKLLLDIVRSPEFSKQVMLMQNSELTQTRHEAKPPA